jgi:hypothetical protein
LMKWLNSVFFASFMWRNPFSIGKLRWLNIFWNYYFLARCSLLVSIFKVYTRICRWSLGHLTIFVAILEEP